MSDELQDNYGYALSLFHNMLEEGHKRYGLSYRERDYTWMLCRHHGEEWEYLEAETNEDKAREAMDNAIVWFLIAHKHQLEGTESGSEEQ